MIADARLLRAYHQTRYGAAGSLVRIGFRPPDSLFERLGAGTAVILTAWNPRSRRFPEGWNRRMQQRLRERLRRFRVMEAEGWLHHWHEAMLLVGGEPQPLIRLSARFRQLAVVVLRRGRKAQLRLLGR